MARAKYQGPTEALEHYERVVNKIDDCDRKGAANPYTSCNGHMTSFLDTTGSMGLRLDRPDRAEFIERYDTDIAEQHGRKMNEFVAVPSELLADLEQLGPWFRRSWEWVGTLAPKPTKRPNKPAAQA